MLQSVGKAPRPAAQTRVGQARIDVVCKQALRLRGGDLRARFAARALVVALQSAALAWVRAAAASTM